MQVRERRSLNELSRSRAENQQFLSQLENMYAQKAQADADWAMFTFQEQHMQQLDLERQRQAGQINLEEQRQRGTLAAAELGEAGATERAELREGAAMERVEFTEAAGIRKEARVAEREKVTFARGLALNLAEEGYDYEAAKQKGHIDLQLQTALKAIDIRIAQAAVDQKWDDSLRQEVIKTGIQYLRESHFVGEKELTVEEKTKVFNEQIAPSFEQFYRKTQQLTYEQMRDLTEAAWETVYSEDASPVEKARANIWNAMAPYGVKPALTPGGMLVPDRAGKEE